MNYKMMLASALLTVACSSIVFAEDKSIASQQSINASVSLSGNISEPIPALNATTTPSSIECCAAGAVYIGLLLSSGYILTIGIKALTNIFIIMEIKAINDENIRLSRMFSEYNKVRFMNH